MTAKYRVEQWTLINKQGRYRSDEGVIVHLWPGYQPTTLCGIRMFKEGRTGLLNDFGAGFSGAKITCKKCRELAPEIVAEEEADDNEEE